MTVEEVAARFLCSTTKISRLETAARCLSLRDVRDLCALYEVGESTSRELMSLVREAREPSWWTHYEDLNLDPLKGDGSDYPLSLPVRMPLRTDTSCCLSLMKIQIYIQSSHRGPGG